MSTKKKSVFMHNVEKNINARIQMEDVDFLYNKDWDIGKIDGYKIVDINVGQLKKEYNKKNVKERKFKKSYGKGEKNSQFGTMWIYNLDKKENKKIKKVDFQKWSSEGWERGRITEDRIWTEKLEEREELRKQKEYEKYRKDHLCECEVNSFIRKNEKMKFGYDNAFYSFFEFMHGDWNYVHNYIEYRGRYKRDINFITWAFHGTRCVLDKWSIYLKLDEDIIYGKDGNIFNLTPELAKRAFSNQYYNLPPYNNEWIYDYVIWGFASYFETTKITNGGFVSSIDSYLSSSLSDFDHKRFLEIDEKSRN